MTLETGTNPYFWGLTEDTGMSYQDLMTLYLRDCARFHQKIIISASSRFIS